MGSTATNNAREGGLLLTRTCAYSRRGVEIVDSAWYASRIGDMPEHIARRQIGFSVEDCVFTHRIECVDSIRPVWRRIH